MHPYPNPGADADVVDAELVADDERAVVGQLVEVVHADSAGREVSRLGQVVDVVDDGQAVRVAYLLEVSDPIPLDHTVHVREDAARVRLYEG